MIPDTAPCTFARILSQLEKGQTYVKGMWSEKKGATYDATVILDGTVGKHINFKLEFSKKEERTDGKNKTLEHLPEVSAIVSTTFPMTESFPLWARHPRLCCLG